MIFMVQIIFQQNNISSLKIPIFWPLLALLQGDKEFFVPSIPKFFCLYVALSSTVCHNIYQYVQIHQGEKSQL